VYSATLPSDTSASISSIASSITSLKKPTYISINQSFAWSRLSTRRGDLVPYNYFNPPTFYWSACSKPGKWAVMYLCVWSIDFASF
jgi:hypothetical protein